ncbi:hypothetical protein C2E21_7720 [Chlorella sorokiniana]|uniref:Uncharacterized protein n=1 Tax=Chlorella sorokiniana TaxID=3076 RepID=A0A2P6TGV7_CHLSO|nr:hypothetical protein C2E21_7720 [Chlorella sorokiniana]|eukprot:PRW33506.1 hypothetical protein C2E21_7720 [Chlorella sorokiniana]
MAARRVSAAEYAAQRDRTTAEQLNLLMADPAFKAWEERKASRGRLVSAAANTALAVACVVLVLALALLRPAAPAAAPHQTLPVSQAVEPATPIAAILTDAPAALDACEPIAAGEEVEALRRQVDALRQEAEAATAALADRDLQLRSEREARAADAQLVQQDEATKAAFEQLRTDKEQLAAEYQRVTAEYQSVAATNQQLRNENQQLAADKQRLAAAAAAAASLTEATAGVAMAALGDVPAAAPAALSALLPPPVAAALAGPAATVYALLAALAIAALTVVLQLRGRRAVAAHAAHAAALAARLKETAFARDTAEKSLELLEGELQHRMKQLGDAQQRAADAASPRIGTAPQPPPAHTPGKGELPPPPASLVEKFLVDHNFLAVQQDQMQEWLEMEQQYREMQAVVEELQSELAERDERLAALEQEGAATPTHEHASVEVRARDDQLAQLRGWLDEAQEELLNTQGALAEREVECRRVSAQLEALQTLAGVAQETAGSMEGREAALLAQNLELAAQLQAVTAAHEDMRAQLSAAAAAGTSTALALGAFGTTSTRPASAASTVPGTPADLSAEVQSCLELMRATRAQLADRLQHSQGVCEEMIAGCQQGAAAQDAEDVAPAADAGAFGSPAPASPASPREESPAVLGVSRRHHANVAHDASPSPPSKLSGESGWGGSSCSPSVSPRSDCGGATPRKAAQARVAEARARTTAWDLAGFVRSLGFQFEDAAVPVERSEFLALKQAACEALAAVAGGAAGRQERALACEALKVLEGWEWPVGRIETPPPSPFWRMLGLQS